MRIIVCGGRDYHDHEALTACLDKVHREKGISMIIEGGANGADAHAATWADNNGIPRVTCHANWKKYGKGAGPKRNAVMLSLNPDGVIAFPGSSGTENMVKQSEKAGVKIWRPYG